MNSKSFKELIQSQQELRNRMFSILKIEPIAMVKLAKEVGVSFRTLMNFLKEEKDVDYVILLKIEKWVQERENMNT